MTMKKIHLASIPPSLRSVTAGSLADSRSTYWRYCWAICVEPGGVGSGHFGFSRPNGRPIEIWTADVVLS